MGLGLSELAILALAVLILIRPSDAPKIARKLGILWVQVKMNWQGIWMGWQEQMDTTKLPRKK